MPRTKKTKSRDEGSESLGPPRSWGLRRRTRIRDRGLDELILDELIKDYDDQRTRNEVG